MKHLFIITLALLALSASAQTRIQDTFFGCKLGVSTSYECYQSLTSQGYKVYHDSDILEDNMVIKYAWHAGIHFYRAVFYFDDMSNKLNEVMFEDLYGSLSSASSAQNAIVKYLKTGGDAIVDKHYFMELPTFTFYTDDMYCSVGLIPYHPNGYRLLVSYKMGDSYEEYY